MIMKKTLGIAASLVFAVTIFTIQSAEAIPPKLNPVPSDYHTGMSWNEAIKTDKPIAVMFYADWCSACKRFAPIFYNYSQKYGSTYNFVIVEADQGKNPEITKDYVITGFPTVYLVDNKTGKKQKLEPGEFFVEEEFQEEMEEFLSETKPVTEID